MPRRNRMELARGARKSSARKQHAEHRQQRSCRFEALEARQVLALVISEFLASNSGGLPDQNGESSDWIELHNTDTAAASLNGWFLKDSGATWQFPNVSIPGKGFLIVFASDKNRRVAGQELHTNFKLSAAGEYLALVQPNGTTIATEFNPFPAQSTNVSYGGSFTTSDSTLLGPNSPAKALIPSSNILGTSWIGTTFNDTGWLSGNTGIGYENDPLSATSYSSLINLNVQSQMYNVRSTAYIRIPFTVANPNNISQIKLRMKYDDGFVAYLNNNLTPVASANAPGAPQWDSAATASYGESFALIFQDFVFPVTPGQLVAGTNILAIQGLNSSTTSSDFLVRPEMVGQGISYNGASISYFTTPTPGLANGLGSQGIVGDTAFSHDRGFYGSAFALTITSPTVDAIIRYTLDGSTPSPINGTIYTAPINIAGTSTVRAIAYKTNFLSSNVDTQTYLFLNDIVNQSPTGTPPPGWPADRSVNNHKFDYGIDPDIKNSPTWGPQLQAALTSIPTFSIVTDLPNLVSASTGIYTNPGGEGAAWERPASVEYILADGTTGFQVNAGLRLRGGFSRSSDNPKHAFRLLFKSEYGDANLNYPLFGDSGAASFDNLDLRSTQNYSWAFQNDPSMTYTRDIFSRDTQRDMGQEYTRGNYAHLYLNGVYWGVFQTQERSEASFGATYYGGEDTDFDVVKAEAGPYELQATDGDLVAWTNLWNKVNTLANSATTTTARFNLYQEIQGLNPDYTPNQAAPVLLDVDNLIDYMLVIFYGGNLDAPISNFLGNTSPNNWYGMRNRDPNARQGFTFLAHDSEHTLNNVNENRMGPYPAGSVLNKSNPQWLHQQLMAEPKYRELFNLHIQQHLRNGGALTPAVALARHQARVDEISTAIIAESARWGDVWKAAGDSPFSKSTWENAVNTIKTNFFPNRTAILLTQLQNTQRNSGGGVLVSAPLYVPSTPLAPTMSLPQSYVTPGTSLAMTNPSGVGTIYYTTDGTDPRLPDGNISPNALSYTGTISLNDTKQIFARTKNGTLWSGYTKQTYATDAAGLRITEIHYHPTETPVGSLYTSDDFEFIEIQNTSGTAIDLQGVRLTSGVEFAFPAQMLGAGQFAVVVKNPVAFATIYPGVTPIGTYSQKLDNGGEDFLLVDSLDATLVNAEFNDTWYEHTDGGGFTLVINDTSLPGANADRRTYWRPSALSNGNPGAADAGLVLDAVVINEVLSNTTAAGGDYIELRNTTNAPINIGGWYLSNAATNLTKFRIPAGTVIPANSYLLYTQQTHFGNAGNPNTLNAFNFSAVSDAVYLTSIDGSGNLAGYRDDKDFAGAPPEVPFGRYVKASGNSDFVSQTAKSAGGANASPLIGPIVINELLTRPALGNDEFIEIRNISGAAVQLFDPSVPANTWQFSDGVVFTFPAGQSLAAGAYALVVPIAPATFRTKYNIPAAIAIYGPYTSALNADGELVRLSKPGTAVGGIVPLISVDHVDFEGVAPWPVEPTLGNGRTLSRLNSSAYGNDSMNWGTSRLNGGSPGALNTFADTTPPTTPSGLAAAATTGGISLTWTAPRDFESGVASYRIYRGGALLGTSAFAAYVDATAIPGTLYSYTASALNPDGFESPQSTAASLRLLGVRGITEGNPVTLVLTFSENVTPVTAQAAANYSLAGNTVNSAVLGIDQKTVTLTLAAALANNATYLLNVSNIATPGSGALPGLVSLQFTTNISGGGLRGEYYDNQDLTALFATRTDAAINFNWSGIAPIAGMGADTFSMRWTGQVIARYTETYNFSTLSDDGVRLWVDNQLIVDNWTFHAPTTNVGSLALQAGQVYDVKLEFFQGGGGANMVLSWASPTVPTQIIAQNRLIPIGTAPSAASGLSAIAVGTTQVRLNWTDNANSESEFRILRSTDGTNFAQVGATPRNAVTYVDATAVNGATYTYRVVAANAVGAAANSNSAVVLVTFAAPAAPGTLAVSSPMNNSLQLTWGDLAGNEDRYHIERSTNGVNFTFFLNTAPNSSTFTDTNLGPGTYFYRVAAENSAGLSAYSNIASGVPVASLPAAPTSLAANAATPTSVSLTWTDNAANEDGFKIERATDGVNFSSLVTLGANVISYNNISLTPGTTYTYRIYAYNGAGNSGFSNTAFATPNYSTPAAPSGLNATVDSPTSVALAWADNSNNETGFKIERSTDNVNFALIFTTAANATGYTNTGLTSGQIYYYRVQAFNPGFNSTFSNTANATPNVALPAAPSGLSATVAGSTQINLLWTDNANNEDNYLIERSTNNVNFSQITSIGANSTTYPSTGLTTGTTYYYRVRAANAAGSSSPSNTASGTPTLNSIPGPANLLAASVGLDRVVLNWTDTSIDERFFHLERSVNGGPFARLSRVSANVMGYADESLSPGVSYAYRVQFQNSEGRYSEFSNTLTVTPNASAGLQLRLKLDDLSGTVVTDSSGQENVANILAGANWNAGVSGPGSLWFAGGNARVQVNNAAALNPSSGLSVAAWLKPTAWSGSSAVLQKGAADNQYRLFQDGTNIRFEIAGVGSVAAPLPALDVWTHVIGSYDGTRIRLFINGESVAGTAASGAVPVTTDPLFIGTRSAGAVAAEQFTGGIDDVRVYSRGFGFSEARQLGTMGPDNVIKIDFQPAANPTYADYLVDSGAIYGVRGNGYSYGWNANTSAAAADRNQPFAQDERFDTVIQTQAAANPNASWSIAVPNGVYQVRLIAGDADVVSGTYRFNVEGQSVLSGTTNTSNRWLEATGVVSVTDGQLTITNGSGSSGNNALAYVELNAIPTADIIDVAPDPRNSGVAMINIAFSEPVTGFDMSDLTLTRDGGANLLGPTNQYLRTNDNITWTLSGIGQITGVAGTYLLSANTGVGISDAAGAALQLAAVESWVFGSGGLSAGEIVALGGEPAANPVAISAASPIQTTAPAAQSAASPLKAGIATTTLSTLSGLNGKSVTLAGPRLASELKSLAKSAAGAALLRGIADELAGQRQAALRDVADSLHSIRNAKPSKPAADYFAELGKSW